MRGAFKLPKFTVVVWVRKTDDYPTIRDELLELAQDDPYESTEYEGMVDFHWASIMRHGPTNSPIRFAK